MRQVKGYKIDMWQVEGVGGRQKGYKTVTRGTRQLQDV